ncbi:MAG: aminotransferase class V-fold PLP-dependent enzyme [Acidipila sp.]|nr:aminotransferase class V-fold PLP-dependent enzyme [Acidipila sp.]
MPTCTEFASVRARFPVFKNKIYLNSCSQGALSDAVEASLLQHIRSWHEDGSPWERWVEQYESARASFARFIGAQPDEVAIVPCASTGISAIASALNFSGQRRKVVMGEFEFPTMGQIWLAQQSRGAEIQFVAAKDGRIPASAYAEAIDERTLLVPLTHVCFMNGARSDVPAITKLARDRGALTMLDDYQDCGTRPVDVKALDLDFYVSGALKYMLCPSGVAFLYVRPELIRSLTPTITGWFGQRNPFAFDVKHFDPAVTARRFESGSPPIPHVYAVPAALELLGSVGFDRIAEHVATLAQALLAGARELKIKIKTPADTRGPLVVLQMKNSEAAVKKLASHNIVVSNRMDGLRVSFHLYNTLDDVGAVLEVLQENLNLTVRDLGD